MKKLLLATTLVLGMLGFAKADTTTSRFLLTKPDVGSTNWGPKINVNYDLIDLAAGIGIANTFTSSNTFNAATAFGAQVLNAAGSASAPSVSFTGSPTSGFYLGASGVIEVGTIGSRAFEIGNSSVTSVYPMFLPVGSVSAPSLTFTGFSSSGFFMDSSTIGWVSAGSTAAYVNSAGLVVPGGKTFSPNGGIIDRNLTAGTTWDMLMSSGTGQAPVWSHAGRYLQFASSFDAVGFATALTTFQNTKLGITITPKFTSSMLILEAYGTGDNNANTGNCFVTFSKGATNLSSNGNGGLILYNNITARVALPIAVKYVDTNLTSGPTTYWLQVRSSGVGTCTFGENTEQDWMYITEIGR